MQSPLPLRQPEHRLCFWASRHIVLSGTDFCVGLATFVWAWRRYAEVHWLRVPQHLRRGLIRLYFAVSVPWVAWFAFKILITTPRSGHLANAFWSMLIVPIGGPALFFVIAWVVAGFQKSGFKPETQSAAKPHYRPLHTHRLPHDFYAVISGAVGALTINNFATRRELYREARNALHNELRGQERSHTEKERRALEHAIRKVEEESATEEGNRRLVKPKPTASS